jgi:hypothetical protein
MVLILSGRMCQSPSVMPIVVSRDFSSAPPELLLVSALTRARYR